MNDFSSPDAQGIQAPCASAPPHDTQEGYDDEGTGSAIDAYRQYMTEITAIPLLGEMQEAALFADITSGREEAEKRSSSPERDTILQAAQAARRQLILANLRLVVSVALRYAPPATPLVLDLIQEGNVGLMHAVEKFDPTRGVRFATYAHYWIAQAITRSLDQDRLIHMPQHVIDRERQTRRLCDSLTDEYGRTPSPEDVAAAFHISIAKAQALLERVHDPVTGTIRSLDTALDADNPASTLGAAIIDAATPTPDELVIEQMNREEARRVVATLLSRLSPQQQEILRLRFGLGGERAHTLLEVAKRLGLSHQRISYVHIEALRALCAHYTSREQAEKEAVKARSGRHAHRS